MPCSASLVRKPPQSPVSCVFCQKSPTTVPGNPNTGPLLKKGKRTGERLAMEALSVWTGRQSGAACVAPGGSPLASMWRKPAKFWSASAIATESKEMARMHGARWFTLRHDFIVLTLFSQVLEDSAKNATWLRWHDDFTQDPIVIVGRVAQAADVDFRAMRQDSARV